MDEKERKVDYIFIVRNAAESLQADLKSVRKKYERIHSDYLSVMLEYDEAVNTYEQRMKSLRSFAKSKGLSDSEIENLTKWRED